MTAGGYTPDFRRDKDPGLIEIAIPKILKERGLTTDNVEESVSPMYGVVVTRETMGKYHNAVCIHTVYINTVTHGKNVAIPGWYRAYQDIRCCPEIAIFQPQALLRPSSLEDIAQKVVAYLTADVHI